MDLAADLLWLNLFPQVFLPDWQFFAPDLLPIFALDVLLINQLTARCQCGTRKSNRRCNWWELSNKARSWSSGSANKRHAKLAKTENWDSIYQANVEWDGNENIWIVHKVSLKIFNCAHNVKIWSESSFLSKFTVLLNVHKILLKFTNLGLIDLSLF